MLGDNVESAQQMCRTLGHHLAFANTLSPDRPPLRAPLQFHSKLMHAHPHGTAGSFDFVKKVNEANAVVISHGVDNRGTQIVEPPAIVMPAPLPAPTSNAAGAGAGADSVSNGELAALAAMRTMTQVHAQSDQRNACVSQQQARLQAATQQSNAQQLEHLTNHLGNLGHEVGRAVSAHPTHHSHALQATLNPSNTVAGQSTDPRVSGSLTCPIPISMSLATFDCGPCAQACQPQPHDKNTRRIDEATHQIVQRCPHNLAKA